MHTPSQNIATNYVMYALGLIFIALATAILLFSILPSLYDWARMTVWVQTPATLIHAELRTKAVNRTHTHRVVGTYHYRFEGRRHIGQRMGIDYVSDKLGDWHESTYKALMGDSLKVWVNPDNPREAIFDRGLRPGLLIIKLILVTLFGSIGAMVLWILRSRPEHGDHAPA